MRIVPTPPALVGSLWPILKPLVERVLAECRGRRDMTTTAHEMLSGAVATWIVFDEGADKTIGFVTARVCQYDGFRLLGVELVAGEKIAEWEDDVMRELIAFAKDKKCSGLEGYGRGAAWARRQRGRYNWQECFRTVELIFGEDDASAGP